MNLIDNHAAAVIIARATAYMDAMEKFMEGYDKLVADDVPESYAVEKLESAASALDRADTCIALLEEFHADIPAAVNSRNVALSNGLACRRSQSETRSAMAR